MASGLTSKVRLVRCPKCRKVLPELADVPVYKCGGCDAVLIAKNQKIDDAESTSGLDETDAAKTNKSDHVFEYKESRSSSHVLPSSGECSLDQNDGRNQNESVECNSEQLGDVNLSNEDQNNENQRYESWDCNTKQSEVSNEVCSSTELAHHENKEFSPLVGANSDVELDDESTLLAEVESEVEINNMSDSNFRSSTTGNLPLATRESNSIVTAHRPADILVSPPNEQPKQPQKNGCHSFDRSMSTDTFESTGFFSPSSELNGTLEYLSKSPTTKSSHAYDGSVSSYDGRDDQFPDQHMHSFKTTYKGTRFVVPEERLRRDKFLVNRMSMINSNPEMQQQPRNSLSVFSTEKLYAIKHSKWDRDELLEPSRHGHLVRNWTRPGRNEYQSQVPFYPRGSLAAYESGSSSDQLHNEFHCNSSLHSLETPECAGQDQTSLLRMVYELEDQLNKTSLLNGKKSGRAEPIGVNWKEKHIPTYHDHGAPEQIYHNLNYPRYPGRQGQGGGWSQQSKCSRRPFSGEVTNSRYQVDHSSLCCHPLDWQCSGQLPLPVVQHDNGFRRIHPTHNCYDSYSSCPSSPQIYMDSEFPMWIREAQSDDQRHRDNAVKMYPRERHHVVKRHLRPTAGGAPFVTCYCCLKPLQLPADFLISKRRCHLLKCGACSEVLKFSLRNRSHIVRYTPRAVDPQPSDIDDLGDSVNDRNLASASYGNDCSHADPVSSSDDYGLSFCKSFSTDGDPLSLAPFCKSQGSGDVRNMSYDSSKTMGERSEVLLKQSRGKYKNPGETFESAGNSFNMSKPEKVSSENGELPPARGSRLHQLMGYSSPFAVLRGTELLDTGTNSYYPEENLKSKN